MTKKHESQEWLYNEYVTNNRSSKDLSKELHVSYKLIEIWLKKFNIPVRKPLI
jgi:transposase